MKEMVGLLASEPVTISSDEVEILRRVLRRKKNTLYEETGEFYALLSSSPDALYGPDDASGDARGLAIGFDGRIDNKEELAERLDCECVEKELLRRAYLKWGNRMFQQVLGDFAAVIYDSQSRQGILGRDPIGIRTLYYHVSCRRVMFATDLEDLIAVVRSELVPDGEYIVQFITGEPTPDATPFKNFLQVGPGEVVTARLDGMRRGRYWNLDLGRSIVYKNDTEYELHFAELFRNSVRRRLPPSGTAVAELSGGFDSSSIVCLASSLLREGGRPPSSLRTVSYIFDRSISADESVFISAVEDQIGMPGLHLQESEFEPLSGLTTRAPSAMPNHLWIWGAREERLAQFVTEQGSGVLLRGTGGDHLLWSSTGSPPELADLLRQWRFLQFHRDILQWGVAVQRPYWNLLFRGGLMPLFPDRIRRVLAKPPSGSNLLQSPHDTRPAAMDNWKEICANYHGAAPSRKMRARALYGAILVVASGWHQQLRIETAYPFLDRELIEFCVAVPMGQIIRPGQTRSLHKRGLAGYLPEAVKNRQFKASFAEVYARAFVREEKRLRAFMVQPQVVARGYVNPTELVRVFNQAKHGNLVDTGPLFQILCLESWLRGLGSLVSKH